MFLALQLPSSHFLPAAMAAFLDANSAMRRRSTVLDPIPRPPFLVTGPASSSSDSSSLSSAPRLHNYIEQKYYCSLKLTRVRVVVDHCPSPRPSPRPSPMPQHARNPTSFSISLMPLGRGTSSTHVTPSIGGFTQI